MNTEKWLIWAAVGLALLLVSAGVRGCWSDNVKDYDVTRRLRVECAAKGGSYNAGSDRSRPVGCYRITMEPL